MSIQLVIDTLQQYKVCNSTKELKSHYPFEMKRREVYLDNVIRQLAHYHRSGNSQNLQLLADDMRHCMLHQYYPELPFEELNNGFNFKRTLEDVVQLLDSEDTVIHAA